MKRRLLTMIALVLMVSACGHRTLLTLPNGNNGKGKPPPANTSQTTEADDSRETQRP